MMDELELLKKDWQKRDSELPKLSYDEIHKMLWKKSSSIVKWILIISILEFTLPHLLYLVPSVKSDMKVFEDMGLNTIFLAVSIPYYLVVIYFIYQFYIRYKEISVLDDAKNLMSKIIKTRKTVKNYIIFCLCALFATYLIVILGIYLNDNILEAFTLSEKTRDISPEKFKRVIMLAIAIIGIASTLFMGGVYYLIYGLLLRRLKKNHHELKRLEV